MKLRIKPYLLCVMLFCFCGACSEGTLDLTPNLDNKWDPANPDYASLPEIPRDGLLAEYLFDGTVSDSSGNGRDCTGTAGTFTADRIDNDSSALALDGEDDYLSVPAAALCKFLVNGTTTISFWFRTTVSGGYAFGSSAYRDGCGWSLKTTSQGLFFSTGVNYSSDDLDISVGYVYNDYDTDIADGVWHHIVMMNNGLKIEFYVDTELDNSFSTNNIKYDSEAGDYFFIGAVYDNAIGSAYVLDDFYTGALDNIRIYERNLTQDEIRALFMEGKL